MYLLNDKLKKLSKSKYLPFVVLFFVMLFLHAMMRPGIMDDSLFVTILKKFDLFNWLNIRYYTWSSRLIIEALMVCFLNAGSVIWKIFSSLMFVLLVYSISKLFVKDNFVKNNWLIVLFIMIFPIDILGNAGWATTSFNYLWPLALGMFSLIPLKKIMNGEKILIEEYIVYTLALTFAVNQEQMAIVIFIIYFIFIIYSFLKKKRSVFPILMLLITIVSLIFISTCPGNHLRFAYDVPRIYTNYYMLSLVDKIVLGLSATMSHILVKHNFMFLLVSGIMFMVVYKTIPKKSYRVIAFLPFITSVLLGIFFNISFIFSLSQGNVVDYYSRAFIIDAGNFYNLTAYIPIILYLIVIGTFLITLYLIFKNTYKTILCIVIFGIGLCTRMVLGFSPTVFESSYRPDTFMVFAIILCGFMVFKDISDDKEYKQKGYKILLGASILSLAVNVVYVLTYQ